MPIENYEHWVHGVATIVEAPAKTKKIAHWGGNTWVDQEANSYNWFHLAIPTPAVANSKIAYLEYVHVHAHMSENARLAEVHIWNGANRVYTKTCVFTDEDVYEKFKLEEPVKVSGGINCCLKVEFLTGDKLGRATIYGAGGHFHA